MTALVDAVLNRDVGRVVALLRAGANPDEPDEDGMCPLNAAVENGDLACLEHLLAAGAEAGGGPLVYAAWASASSEELLERLLRAGADPDQGDDAGSTALYMAAVGGFPGRVRVLLAAGADPNLDSAGPSDGSPLCGASCWGHEPTVRALLEGGADPNQAEQDGVLPLEWAVRGMHHASAGALLEAGAEPNAPCAPLVIAADHGSIGLVRLLLAHGADPALPDPRGRLALTAAEAKVGLDVEATLSGGLAGEGVLEIRREPREAGSEYIEVTRRNLDGAASITTSETGHAQIVALLRGA